MILQQSMRIAVLMFIVLGISVSAAGAGAYNYTMITSPERGLALEGASEVLMPHVSLVTPEGNWTYPYDYYPVYPQNQTISGIIFEPDNLTVGVAALRLNTSSFQEALKGLSKLVASGRVELLGFSALTFNRTGKGHFVLPGMPPGLYALVVANLSNLSVTTTLPMLLTNDHIAMESPDNVKTGDVLDVRIKVLEGRKNISRNYAAAIISEADYRAVRINMRDNGSKSGLISQIIIGNRSLQVLGEPKISLKLVGDVLPILPGNSAATMEQSNRNESEMYLLTDQTWKPGRYVLTCGAYSSKGLDGIIQKTIEMI